jgi:hypothetical protein
MSSNGIKENSSFWRPHGSKGDKQSAPISSGWGRPVSSNHPATGGGESERPPSSFKPPAAGGSGWGRPPGPLSSSAAVGGKWGPSSSNRPAAVGGRWGGPPSPPNFTVVLIAALLLLPGVTQPIADEFTQAYIERNHIVDPHTQNDIDRAIAAFNRQHPQKVPAPPVGYTAEYISHCFHEKYELPENLREGFESFVQSYLVKNPKQFTMMLQTAVDRALLRIHESLSEGNGGQIPERESSKIAQKTESQEFFERLTKHLLKSYLWITPEIVHAFISKYRSKPIDQLFFSESTLDDDAYQMRVKFAFSELHFHHADYFFRTSFINPFVLIGFHDGVLPVRALHPSFHRIVELATIQPDGNVMNAFVFVYKPEYDLHRRLAETLIGHSYQSDPIYAKWNFQSRLFVKVVSGFSIGDIMLVMPAQILKVGRPVVKQVMWRAGGGSQYAEAIEIGKQITDYMPPESHKVAGGKVDWKDTNAVVEMTAFQKFMIELGGKKIKVVPS